MVRKDNFDWLHVNSGSERSGKSSFAFWVAMIASKYGGLNFDWEGLSTVFFAEKDLPKKLMNVPNKSICVLDEAGEALFSRSAIQREQISLIKVLMAFGAKNIFLQANIPNWRWLDIFARQERIKSLAVIQTKGRAVADGEGTRGTRGRGYFSIYPRMQVMQAARVFAGQQCKLQNPSFFGYAPAFKWYYPDIWARYEKKKFAYLEEKKKYNVDREPLQAVKDERGFF